MTHAKGFTLKELLAVIVILAVVGTLIIVIVVMGNRGSHQSYCKANLNSLGKALAMYNQTQGDSYPMMPGNAWDTTPDGTNYQTSPYNSNGTFKTKARSVTSLMFLLVRDGQGPKIFNCGSDKDAVMDRNTTNNSGQVNWDFSSGQAGAGIGTERNVSYSYQLPIPRAAGAATDKSGIFPSPDSALVVMSDRAPGKRSDMNYMSSWTASTSPQDVHGYMSQNHSGGEVMNILYADCHVGEVKTPNCGPSVYGTTAMDCIFTAKDNTGNTEQKYWEDGAEFGGVQDYKKHKGTRDSYLSGGRDPG